MEDLIISDIYQEQITIKNKQEIIEYLKENLEKYNKVITEEIIKEGKEDRAKLNKLSKAIDEKRKEVKKKVLYSYEEVEKDFKEITDLINESSSKIDVQIKGFEEEQKLKKKNEIDKLLENNTTGVKFYNEKWLNNTYKIKDIEQEIVEFVNKFNQDMELLKDEDVVIKDYYKRTLNISATLLEKKRIEELRKQEELRKEELKAKLLEHSANAIEEVKENVVKNEVLETTSLLTLEFNITRAEAIKLKQFLVENNIEHRKVGN